jgi:hypothetical protein
MDPYSKLTPSERQQLENEEMQNLKHAVDLPLWSGEVNEARLAEVVQRMGIKSPVRVRPRFLPQGTFGASGFKIGRHEVLLQRGFNVQALQRTLAHELRHAWQHEQWGEARMDAIYEKSYFSWGEPNWPEYYASESEQDARAFAREHWREFDGVLVPANLATSTNREVN